jgi:quercetin dioxygenase-like cupin family protein
MQQSIRFLLSAFTLIGFVAISACAPATGSPPPAPVAAPAAQPTTPPPPTNTSAPATSVPPTFTAFPTVNTIFPTLETAPPQSAPPLRIIRNQLFEEIVEFESRPYRMDIVELIFGPGAETPVHVHLGPSSGYMMNGRITVNVVGESRSSTYSAGSAIAHPWDRPHIFRNTGDESVRMLSFELSPV